MDVVMGIGDWLATTTDVLSWDTTEERSDEAVLAAFVALVSRAQQLIGLDPPPSALFRVVTVAVGTLPLQMAHVEPDSAFGQWLAVAASAEQAGYAPLSQLLVNAVRETIEQSAASAAVPDPTTAEYCAICWCRRGRIARVAGHLEDARECYERGRALVARAPCRDARALAELGLCAVAADHGNFPDVARRASRLLRQDPIPAAPHRFAAHHFLTLAQRRRGRLVDALLHGWAAFDLAPVGDVRRPELLITLAEVALALGDVAAAAHGFDTVLQSRTPSRVRVSALVGAIQATLRHVADAAHPVTVSQLRPRMVALRELTGGSLAPRDEARAMLALAEAHHLLRERSEASRCLASATRIADSLQLFELQFRADAMRTRIHHGKTEASNGSNRPRRGARHPAVARLLQTVLT